MDNVKDWLLHLPMGMLALSIPLISKILAADLHATAATSAISVALAAAIAQSGRRMSVERRRAVAKSTTYMATLFLGCFYTTLGICAGSGIGAVHIFLLSTVVLLGHLVLAFLGCELLNVACGRRIIKLPIFLVASNAAVGGPSTATTFAESLEWTELVVPAAVCGTLGYALGTPVAFALMKCFPPSHDQCAPVTFYWPLASSPESPQRVVQGTSDWCSMLQCRSGILMSCALQQASEHLADRWTACSFYGAIGAAVEATTLSIACCSCRTDVYR